MISSWNFNPIQSFMVAIWPVRIGCGIAGFADKEIAPLFIKAIDVQNIHLPESFWKELV